MESFSSGWFGEIKSRKAAEIYQKKKARGIVYLTAYFISTKDGKGVMNVRMYTLGNQQPEEDRRYIYIFGEKDFGWYKKEWEYSWEN